MSKELTRLLCTDGSELSIVAYGQTGTGKTYTTTYLEGEPTLSLSRRAGSQHPILQSALLERSLSISPPDTMPKSLSVYWKFVARPHMTCSPVQPSNLSRFQLLG